jgi:hypothetical protein
MEGRAASFTLLPLYFLWNSPRYPLYRRLGGPQSWSGRYVEEKNLLPLAGIQPRLLGCPVRSLVPIPTELSWLRLPILKGLIRLWLISRIVRLQPFAIVGIKACHAILNRLHIGSIPHFDSSAKTSHETLIRKHDTDVTINSGYKMAESLVSFRST